MKTILKGSNKMNKDDNRSLTNENGSAIVVALFILVALTIIGFAAVNTSNLDIMISRNDRSEKVAFYSADGSTEMATELLEQNIATGTGFTSTSYGEGGYISIMDTNFWTEEVSSVPSEDNWDFCIPAANCPLTGSLTKPYTNFSIGGDAEISQGSAIQMASGYAGKGKSIAGGGTSLIYDVFSEHQGNWNSKSTVMVQWRHVVGIE
ncbi:pilus assembly PilX N-terminal domain-containing protein [Desulfobacterales bacterium HSG17]|nr:pilus assembly PilX N-terminal domain-containing protein [Desulfobacterales bacterium HSG17]